MRSRYRGVWAIVGVVLLSAILGGFYGPRVQANSGSPDGEIQDAIRSFTKVYSIIEQNYADPVDPEAAVFQGAIPGMLRTLDPHSSFFDEKTFTQLREEQSGHYFGVGMQVGPRDGNTVVVVPFPGSPAFQAGLRPGDIVYRVDGTRCEGLTTSEVAGLLKGPKGTVVHVEVLREGYDEPLSFVITRDEIQNPSVQYSFEIRPGIGYIRLARFNETSEDEITDAIEKLGGNRLNGLILDLRGNPGGLLNAAVGISDLFLRKNQLIVSQQGRRHREQSYYANATADRLDVPLVVLVNRQSASASEIVSGALQDHDRALIVGDTTFGKALVQTVYPLSYNTGMALTTARYYTPSGRLIQRDYSGVSLYNYYTSNHTADTAREIFRTDGGRTVFGGGGITPDVVVPTPELTDFQERLMHRLVLYPLDVGVGDFVKRYLSHHKKIDETFEVDERVLGEFRRLLNEKNISYTETDIQENLAWLKNRIKKEIFTSVFSTDKGFQVAAEADPQIQAALDLLPKAKQLLDEHQRQVARRER